MTRELFVDTNVLLGLTFYSDRWFKQARPVFANDHQIHVSDLVVFEYCCNRITEPPDDPEQLDIDWENNEGVYGHIRSKLSKPYREYRSTIRKLGDEEVSVDRAVREFINLFSIRTEAESQVRAEFEREFRNKSVTRQYINEFVSELIDKILNAARAMKEALSVRVTVHNSVYHTATELRRKWETYPQSSPPEPDLSIVVDGTAVISDSGVDTLLSGDSDILALQKIADEYFKFDILSLADEYSTN